MSAMSTPLHVHEFGPPDGPPILAVHGVTGHGGRWRAMAKAELPHARVIAPDLCGHGHSPYRPPWTIEQHVADLVAVLDAAGVPRVVVLGHSFGGAIGVHLARTVPQRVSALVLLDPAIGIDPARAQESAEDSCTPDRWDDTAAATADKALAWDGVPQALVDAEVAEHLARQSDGRWAWRTYAPAVVTAWNEMSRPFVVPPPGIPTVFVPASRVQPPFVSAAFRAALAAELGDYLTVHPLDCAHMVPQLLPAQVGTLLRPLLER